MFKAPLLLVRKSTGTDFTCRAAVTDEDVVYQDAITGIHGDSLDVLRNIAGLLNSRLFPYYALMNLSSIGTEREQAHNIEKFSMPYIDGGISRHVEKIETLYKEYESGLIQSQNTIKNQIESEKKAIERCIVNELGMTVREQYLVDYAINYTIPLATGKPVVKDILNNGTGQKVMKSYAQVFLDRFNGQFGKGTCLNYTCDVSASHVMLRFFVSSENNEPIFKTVSLGAMERFLLSLSSEGLSESLYLRKDIRGFEKEGFYIVKPCEQRLWHPAVAYADAEEFVEAMFSNKNGK